MDEGTRIINALHLLLFYERRPRHLPYELNIHYYYVSLVIFEEIGDGAMFWRCLIQIVSVYEIIYKT